MESVNDSTDQATAPPEKKRRKKDGEPAALSRFDRYEFAEVHRSELVGAPYNPRTLSAEARRRLKANIERVGLTHPIVWNRRTAHVVSGHQRLGVIDSLERTKDYRLRVAVVDLSEEEEKAQNVFENNPAAQGEYDSAALEKMFKDDKIDWDAAGFSTAEVYEMFGQQPLISQPDRMAEMAEKIREAQKRSERISNLGGERDTDTFMRVLVFKDTAAAREFDASIGHDGGRYVDPRRLRVGRVEDA